MRDDAAAAESRWISIRLGYGGRRRYWARAVPTGLGIFSRRNRFDYQLRAPRTLSF